MLPRSDNSGGPVGEILQNTKNSGEFSPRPPSV